MVQANDPAVDQVLGALFRVIRQVKQTVQADPVDRAAISILHQLRDRDSARLSDLATNLCLDISTVSRQAKTLEDRGLITRSEDPEDRRAQRIHLAPAGRDILADAWARRHAWLAEALADWSPDDRAELVDVLTRFADSLRADPAPEPPTADQPASDQSASDQPTSYTPTNRETTA